MDTLKKSAIILVCLLWVSFTYAQDIIVLQDGDEIKASVIEIAPEVIKYKKFENLDGPVYWIEKMKVFMIRFEDGTKEVFQNDATRVITEESETKPIYPVIPTETGNKVGIKAGINLASLATNYSSNTSTDTEYKIRPAFHFGIVADFEVSDHFGIQPALLFSSKGASIDDDFDDGDYVRRIFHYLEVDLNLRYSISELDIFAGPYLGIGIGGERTTSFSGNESSTDIIYRPAELDLEDLDEEGIVQQLIDMGVNVGIAYNISDSFGISAGYGLGLRNVNLSLTDGDESVFNADDIKVFNRVITVSIIYLMNLKN